MRLPLFVSVPHAGLAVPDELRDYQQLSPAQIAADGDVEAAEIYQLDDEVQGLQRASVARAFIDLNRARDDRSKDGAFKTHTCWDEPIYQPTPPEALVERMLVQYWAPYHQHLAALAEREDLLLCIDGHTMAAKGPPVGPDPGTRRPTVCLGDARGLCPAPLSDSLFACLQEAFEGDVTRNEPFAGGYITRYHGQRRPWIQLEIARGGPLQPTDKRQRLLEALRAFCTGQ